MKKIYVSPSDQKANDYAYGNTNEATVCREIAKKLCVALERCGFETKADYADGSNAMYERCKQSNAWGADLHICIHTNAYNGAVSGTRMFCYSKSDESYKACKSIFDQLAPITPGTSENIQAKPDLYEIRAPKAPTAYIEVDFHDVPNVAKWLIENTETIAEAICKGVCVHFGVSYKSSETTSEALYKVQVGAFRNKENAEKQLQKLKNYGFSDVFIVKV